MTEASKCVLGEYCSRHQFIHGAEAEELRERIQALADGSHKPLRADLRQPLDDVDARDSVAYLEVRARLEAEDEG